MPCGNRLQIYIDKSLTITCPSQQRLANIRTCGWYQYSKKNIKQNIRSWQVKTQITPSFLSAQLCGPNILSSFGIDKTGKAGNVPVLVSPVALTSIMYTAQVIKR